MNLNSGDDGSMHLIKINEISEIKKRILKLKSNKFKCYVEVKKIYF